MSTQTISRAEEIVEIFDRMPPDGVIIQHGVDWNDYEELLEAVDEAKGLRISYREGRLQIMTLSPKREKYTRLLWWVCSLCGVASECSSMVRPPSRSTRNKRAWSPMLAFTSKMQF